MEENQNVYGVWVPTHQCPRKCPWCLTRPRNRSSPFMGAEIFLRAAQRRLGADLYAKVFGAELAL